jgi:hypothetical protein
MTSHDYHALGGRLVTSAWWTEHVGAPLRSGPVGIILAECSECGHHVTIAGNPLAVEGYYGVTDAVADNYFTAQTMPVILAGWPGEWDGLPTMVAAEALAVGA